MMGVILELAFVGLFVYIIYLIQKMCMPDVQYIQAKYKYKLYRLIKEFEKRKISLGEIDKYIRENLDGRSKNIERMTVKEIDKEVEEEFKEEKEKGK